MIGGTIEGRFQTREAEYAREYLYPITSTLISATTEGAAETLVTVRDDSLGKIESLAVSNQSGTAATLTLYFIPDGGTIGVGNKVLTAKSIPANDAVKLTELVGQLLAPGTVIKAFAGTTDVLFISGHLRGVL